MAHEITIRANGKAEMAYVGETPWHGLGQSLDANASMDEWIEAAGFDWSIRRAAVRYPTSPDTVGDVSTWRTIDDKHVLMRSDNGEALGIVSDNYKVVQPREVAEFFADQGFQVETMGTLFGGRRFWALARMADGQSIMDKNDKVGGFVLLSTSADGTLATEARMTAIRVVCNNTLSLARSVSKAQYKVKHKTQFCEKTAKKSLGLNKDDALNQFETAMDEFRSMARKRMDRQEMVHATLELFGHKPAEMSTLELVDAAKTPLVSAIGTLAVTGRNLIGADLMGGNGSAWAWLNSVTQYVDHMARAKSQSHRMDSAWFGRGDALKSKAYEIALGTLGQTQIVTYESDDTSSGLLDSVLAATAQ